MWPSGVVIRKDAERFSADVVDVPEDLLQVGTVVFNCSRRADVRRHFLGESRPFLRKDAAERHEKKKAFMALHDSRGTSARSSGSKRRTVRRAVIE